VVTTELTFAEAKRRAALDHVHAATRRYVLDNGLDATMDQLAAAAGVSRRTLFRMFGTRERLIVAAFGAGMESYRHDLPGYQGDIQKWLLLTCETAHRLNSSVGPGFWELTSRSDLPPDLSALEQIRRKSYRARTSEIAGLLWQECGGIGKTPDELLSCVSAHLSPHFTAAVATDSGRDHAVAAVLAYQAIMSTVHRLTNPTSTGAGTVRRTRT
jgi:AcrR family transcriptional regulator